MSRRLPTAGFALATLLAALAWTAHTAAKPPDLPLVNKDVLAPQTPFVPTERTGPSQPNPFPLVAETPAAPAMEMPSLLQMRPSTRRMMASCMLFAAHPLLALAPTADYLDFDDDEVQTVFPAAFLAPATSEAPTGSLLFGVGLNSDAGLTGSIETEPPLSAGRAWSEMLNACWRMFQQTEGDPQPPAENRDGFINYSTPRGYVQGITSGPLTSDLNIPIRPQTPAAIPEVPMEIAPEQSACPWMRQLHCTPDRRTVPFTEADLCPDVLHNLTMLHQAQSLLQNARELGGEGRVFEALDCLDLAHDLCPGGRFDAALQEAAAELFAPIYCGSPRGDVGEGEEQSEPPTEKTKPVDSTQPFHTSRSAGREREIEMKLSQPATLIFKDAPLHQVIDDLRVWQNLNICVDKAALDAEEISLDQLVSINLENVSLKSELHLILRDAHLTYVIKDDVLQITTERAARGKLVRVAFMVADILDDPVRLPGTPSEASKQPVSDGLIKLVTSAISPHDWSENGGPGTIDFDARTRALIVNQTADVQEQVADLLNSLRRLQHPDPDECEETCPCAEKAVTFHLVRIEADPLAYKLQLAADGPTESPSATITPCLPPVDPGTPAALDQLFHESFHSGLIGSGAGEEQEIPVEILKGVAKPDGKTADLKEMGSGKDAGAPISCLDVLKEFMAVAPPGHGELFLGLDGSVRMFTQIHRGGAVWYALYKDGGLSVWASPDGGTDAESTSDDMPSD